MHLGVLLKYYSSSRKYFVSEQLQVCSFRSENLDRRHRSPGSIHFIKFIIIFTVQKNLYKYLILKKFLDTFLSWRHGYPLVKHKTLTLMTLFFSKKFWNYIIFNFRQSIKNTKSMLIVIALNKLDAVFDQWKCASCASDGIFIDIFFSIILNI